MVNDDFHEGVAAGKAEELLANTPRAYSHLEPCITYTKQPHPREYRLIFKNVDREGWDPSIDCYLRDGGYEDLSKALAMQPKAITEEVKKSGLRGRGGAGFPTGDEVDLHPA